MCIILFLWYYDSFTVSESATGNGKLTYPIGLLTTDEVMLGGRKLETYNTSYYLNNNTSYWLGSSSDFVSTGAGGFYVDDYGLVRDFIDCTCGVRPAISLKPRTQISGGSGTSSDPYIVE